MMLSQRADYPNQPHSPTKKRERERESSPDPFKFIHNHGHYWSNMSTNSNAILLRYVVANAIQWIAKNRAMVVKIILVIASLTCYFEIQFNLMRSVVPSSNHNMIDDNQHRHLSMQQQQQQQSQQQQYRSSNSRVLMGIFTADMYKELRYRQAYRELLQTQYPKVCSLHDYKNAIQNTNNMLYDSTSSSILLQHCTLIYTFVLGDGNPNGPTMIVSNETYRSVTVSAETIVSSDTKKKKNNGAYSIDFNSTDMTFLNIK